MVLTSSPADAVVYIDNKKVGTSPVIVNELLIGTHTIRLEKDGYDQQETMVLIAENQESVLDFTLSRIFIDSIIMSATPQGTIVDTITVNGVSFNMIKVEGGSFVMGGTSEQGGDAWTDEKPMHQVTLSDYYIGETEVTQELWQAVMDTNPNYFKGSNLPVEKVSWNDCQTFIAKLNELTGKQFRLPTEAEWEYAARGGNKSKIYKYAGSNTLSHVAWYADNSGSKTHPVKQKNPNELGLYDMSGNVYEWCQDTYGNYTTRQQTNPTGSVDGYYRVYRGGSWSDDTGYCRVSFRGNDKTTSADNYIGLRLVL